VLTYFLLPSRPAEATFLSQTEKNWVADELAHEEAQKGHSMSALQALTNKRVWYLASIQLFFAIAMYALSFWIPQVVRSLVGNSSNTRVGVFVMIPYLVAVVGMLLISRSSDRTLERRYHTAVPMLIAGASLILLGKSNSLVLTLILLSLAALGTFGSLAPFWPIPSAFLSGYSAACGIALVNAIANLGGFVGPYTIGFFNKQTGDFYSGLAVAGASILLSAGMLLVLKMRVKAKKTA
jgi:MFS transporter, ACS family, tartrate transporter